MDSRRAFSPTSSQSEPTARVITDQQSNMHAPTAPSATNQSKLFQPPVTESELFPGQFKPLPEQIILTWQAPARPFKKRNRQYYTTIVAIVFLISLILFFAGQFLPIAVVISVAFLAYVLSSVPPTTAEHKITTYGLRVENVLYYWEELGRFWFEEKFGQPLVQVEVARFPGRLTLLLNEVGQDTMRELLSEVLLEEKPKETFFDSSARWLQEHIPLDNG